MLFDRRSVVIAAITVPLVALLHAQTPAPQAPLPTFRTGVDVVELDVTVLDKDRHPVRGLTAEDFTILDRGQPQPIVAFSAVDVPAPVSYPAPWMREAPLDVVSNVENRRLVTIVMDDAYTDLNPDIGKRAKQIARNAVDELGPADLAAVVFTFMGRAQNFTSDRSRLLTAIDSYMPKQRGGEPPLPCFGPHQPAMRKCDIETLGTVAETVSTASPGRKIVILISGGRAFSFGGPGNIENETPDLSKLFRNLQRANITVYAFDARGLLPPGGMSAERHGLPDPTAPSSALSENESLYTFAASTGGRAIANTNDPQSHVAETFRESSSYYFIGFRATTDSNDKGLRKVEVKVDRPGGQVQTRSGYYPPSKTPTTGDVVNGLPSGDLPVHATAAVVAVPGQRNAELLLAARLDLPVSSPIARTIELAAMAIDMDGKPKGSQRQAVTVTPTASSDLTPDLPAHLRLPPGRFMIQISARSEGRAGSAVVDVDVPDFSKDPLSASGLMLQLRRRAAPITDKGIADLVPFMPTTIRVFHSDDDVDVFLRIYEGGKGRLAPVQVSAKVRDESDAIRSSHEDVLATEYFSEVRSADVKLSLPLAQLSAGEYLLEVDAQSGARHVRRTARFTVVASR
jgi:VWFA-related protein